MVRPLYDARLSDLSAADHIVVTCLACDHWLAIPGGLEHRAKLNPEMRVLDLRDKLRCGQCGARRYRIDITIDWAPVTRSGSPDEPS